MSRSERAPFLGDNNHDDDDDYESSDYRKTPANNYFKRPLRILSGITALLSIAVFGLLIASYVLLVTGPFNYAYNSADAVRDLAIVLMTTFLLTTPTVFFTLPIIIPLVTNLVMAIVTLVFSSQLFANGWPDSNFCYRYKPWDPTDPYRNTPLPETWDCKHARMRVQIMVLVAGIIGLIIGLLLVAKVLLRLTAVFKTKFWRDRKMPFFGAGRSGSGWKPTGFTVQFTLKIVKQEDESRASAAGAAEGSAAPKSVGGQGAEGRLIET